jgi:hypothetical protein
VTPQRPDTSAGPFATAWSLGLILAIGTVVRLYHLGTPSLWADEMQAVFGASFPLDYLARWIMVIEVHPPTYHLLVKLFMAISNDDAILRLPSALAGIATIWLLWRIVREALGEAEGLFAAALLAANPLHIWISRQVRPYGVLIFLFCLSYLYLRRYALGPQLPTSQALGRLCLANIPLLLLHLVSLLILGAQTALLATLALGKRLPIRHVALFLGAGLLSFLPIAPVLRKTLLARPDVTQVTPLPQVLTATLHNIAGFFDFFHTGWMLPAMLACLALGLARLARQRPIELLPPLAFVLVPVAAILAKGYASYYFSTHVSFMLPVLLLPMAAGLGLLARGGWARLAAPVLAAALAAATVFPQAAKLYDTDSNIITWWHFGTFKTMARESLNRFHDGECLVLEDPFIADAVDWYAGQFSTAPPYLSQHLGPKDATARVNLLSLAPDFGDLGQSAAQLRAADPAATAFRLDTLHGLCAVIPRRPVTPVTTLPFVHTFTAAPDDVYAHCRAIEGLAIRSSGGYGLYPVRYDRPGIVEYELENTVDRPPHRLTVGLAFENPGAGNRIDLEYAFDDGPWLKATASDMPQLQKFSLLQFDVPKAFHRLRLRVSLLARLQTPYAVSGNRHALHLDQVFVVLYENSDEGPASETITAWLKRRILDSHAGNGFLGRAPRQTVALSDPAAWSVLHEHPEAQTFVQADRQQPATLTVHLPDPDGDVVFYPRVSGQGQVSVARIEADGTRREIFRLAGLPDYWSPVAARYPLNTGHAPATYEVTLSGGAQLWRLGDDVFFTP